ncbi:MAG: diguanylate cyclase [Nitrospirae bacterium]|nr:diguanylate cyclase [Nitrospirota bacterium]
MSQKLRIALDHRNPEEMEILQLRLQGKGYQVIPLNLLKNAIGLLYLDPPDLVIVDLSTEIAILQTFIQDLKRESYFTPVPLIGLIPEVIADRMEWEKFPLDDFIRLPIVYAELFNRIALSLERMKRVFDNNPLTRLPGNTSIQRAIQLALGQEVAVCYLDINDFKPYNDVYGFARGDEVINMVARIISNAVKPYGEKCFAGHIGGDDFVFITPLDESEKICQKIIDHFNMIVSDLFGEEEKSKRFYIAKNRKGEIEKIPLLGLAIAVIPMTNPVMNHYGKVAESAASLKKLAKRSNGSRYVVERRSS